MTLAWFNQPGSPATIGAKGYNLSLMSCRGLPVPPGFCIPADDMDSLSLPELEEALGRLSAGSVAVRSSAIGEDDGAASFAGIHTTRLNIQTAARVWEALQEIRASVSAPSALAYRQKLGITGIPLMAAVVQEFVDAEAGGVLFMRDPVDGSNRMIIEGSWGSGEGVVSGTVIPDRWVLSPEGKLMANDISEKDVAIVPATEGTIEIEVPESRRRLPCLAPGEITELLRLACLCGNIFGGPQDLEWAVANGKVWLLQSRPITGRQFQFRGR